MPPTPPAAALTTIVSPRPIPCDASASHAVWPGQREAARDIQRQVVGHERQVRLGRRSRCRRGRPTGIEPKTASPAARRSTSSPVASTTPESSRPMRLGSVGVVVAARRAGSCSRPGSDRRTPSARAPRRRPAPRRDAVRCAAPPVRRTRRTSRPGCIVLEPHPDRSAALDSPSDGCTLGPDQLIAQKRRSQ